MLQTSQEQRSLWTPRWKGLSTYILMILSCSSMNVPMAFITLMFHLAPALNLKPYYLFILVLFKQYIVIKSFLPKRKSQERISPEFFKRGSHGQATKNITLSSPTMSYTTLNCPQMTLPVPNKCMALLPL